MPSVLLQAIMGMDLTTLARVLLRNRCRVEARYLPRVALLVVLSAFNSIMAHMERVNDGANIDGAEPVAPPIFILGTWRSGTTHLENLLSCDPTLACPNVYQAMFPHHFVYTQPWGIRYMNFFSPKQRPMDNVALHGAAPHEDEMALAGLCGVSPYLRAMFPVTGDGDYTALDPDKLPPGALDEWQAALRLFVKKLSFSQGMRLVLKSPPHMGRLSVLLKIFPGAKFVHIVRNPYVVFLSSKNLWRTGFSHSHLQTPDPQAIEELVLSWYTELFALYERDKGLIPPGSLHELRFEDLESSPRECLARLYAELNLAGFDRFWEQASRYLESIAGYQKNVYALTEEERATVSQRWGPTFARYGYPLLPPLAPGTACQFS